MEEGSVKHKTGIFSNELEIHKLEKVETISIKQTFIQKILNYGTIVMSSPLMQHQVLINTVADPFSMQPIIEKIISAKQPEQNLEDEEELLAEHKI